MQAYKIKTYGGPEGLEQVELPEPQAQPGEIVVRMRAASLNYRDLMVVGGSYGGNPQPGLIPLSDGAGEVVQAGAESRWKVGGRVAGLFFADWTAGRLDRTLMKSARGGSIDGVLSEFVAMPEHSVVRLPDHLSYEEGATLPCAAVTAWHGLVTKGRVTAGETVLLLGTGGVSIFALQFCKMLGARVIITSSSDEKLERAKGLGADETINYKAIPEWHERVYELTGGRGVDHVVEVGGNGTWEKSLNSLCIGGTMSMIGGVSGFGGQVNPFKTLSNSVTINGIYVGSGEMFEAMNRAITQARLQPVIDRVFPFDEAREAYEYLQSGAHFGKVVISI